ncbi:hypothetical protein PFISCL1PPCAC_3391, partial [Pristionchus fissidentatus]
LCVFEMFRARRDLENFVVEKWVVFLELKLRDKGSRADELAGDFYGNFHRVSDGYEKEQRESEEEPSGHCRFREEATDR